MFFDNLFYLCIYLLFQFFQIYLLLFLHHKKSYFSLNYSLSLSLSYSTNGLLVFHLLFYLLFFWFYIFMIFVISLYLVIPTCFVIIYPILISYYFYILLAYIYSTLTAFLLQVVFINFAVFYLTFFIFLHFIKKFSGNFLHLLDNIFDYLILSRIALGYSSRHDNQYYLIYHCLGIV